jgi:hypothetical protein
MASKAGVTASYFFDRSLRALAGFALRWLHDLTAPSDATKGDCAAQRAPARSDRIAIISGMHKPLTSCVRSAADLADVMRPDHDDAGAWSAGVQAFTRPFARARQAPIRLVLEMHHVEAAPWQPARGRRRRPRKRDYGRLIESLARRTGTLHKARPEKIDERGCHRA